MFVDSWFGLLRVPVVGTLAYLALVVLTDRDFGDWTRELWPAVSDGVLREFGAH